MKKLYLAVAAVLAGSALFGGTTARASAAQFETQAKAAYLCDCETGTAVYGENENSRLPIASMCKIMTLLLSFEAADRGELRYDEKIAVSENAAGMGGSQVFLQAGLCYSAQELMKSVAVCSANDSCVALAERIAGSEGEFVERMNARAKELGAENTLFSNCTGLPREPQYSCAKDVAVMLRAMLSHEKYYEFSRIWTEDFAHPDGRTTLITNTNKLIRSYSGCDGGKTGFTNEAGFCLAATAKRGDTRLVCVVIGEKDSKQRFADVTTLLDTAFASYESRPILIAGAPLEMRAPVRAGQKESASIVPKTSVTAFAEKGSDDNCRVDITLLPLKAPIARGDEVGYAVVYKDGVEIGKSVLLSGEDIGRMSYGEAFRESARNWN